MPLEEDLRSTQINSAQAHSSQATEILTQETVLLSHTTEFWADSEEEKPAAATDTETFLTPTRTLPTRKPHNSTMTPAFLLYSQDKQKFPDKLYLLLTGELPCTSELRSLPMVGNTWIGVSGLFNLDAILHRNQLAQETGANPIQHIIIVDKASSVIKFWHDFQNIVKSAQTAESCTEVLFTYLRKKRREYQLKSDYILQLRAQINDKNHFLSDETTLQAVKTILASQHTLFFQGDLTSWEDVHTIRSYLLQRQLTVDTFYISNIPVYLRTKLEYGEELITQLQANLKQVLPTDTYIIESKEVQDDSDISSSFVQYMFPVSRYGCCHDTPTAKPML